MIFSLFLFRVEQICERQMEHEVHLCGRESNGSVRWVISSPGSFFMISASYKVILNVPECDTHLCVKWFHHNQPDVLHKRRFAANSTDQIWSLENEQVLLKVCFSRVFFLFSVTSMVFDSSVKNNLTRVFLLFSQLRWILFLTLRHISRSAVFVPFQPFKNQRLQSWCIWMIQVDKTETVEQALWTSSFFFQQNISAPSRHLGFDFWCLLFQKCGIFGHVFLIENKWSRIQRL